MKAEKFIHCIQFLKRTNQEYFERNYSLEDIKTYCSYTDVEKRSDAIEINSNNFELIKLYSEYSLKKVHFNWTSFLDAPERLETGWKIALDNVDFVMLEDTGEILLYDQAVYPRFVIRPIAKSLEHFFDAMICMGVNHIHFASAGDENEALVRKRHLIATLAADLAGGHKYYDHWASIAGVDKPPALPID